MDEFIKNLKHSVGMRIFIFVAAFFVCLMLGIVIAAALPSDENTMILRISQGITSAMMFIVPPLVLYAITRSRPMQEIGFRKPSQWWVLLIGVILMFISLPLTNLLTSWNEKMSLGQSFASLEHWMQQAEESTAEVMQRILEVNTVWGLLLNLLIVALIPAVGEELTFRGVLQQALTKGCKNVHVAIVISAAIFSFIHFQFYGFLPRMFLGLILGYLFYYSGSIWTSILMHFVNNASVVVIFYLNQKGLTNIDVDHFGSTSNVLLLIASLVLTVGLIVFVAKNQYKYGRK